MDNESMRDCDNAKAHADLERFLRGFDGVPTEELLAGTGYVAGDCSVRGSVLGEASQIINGERQDVYGSPEQSFALIADYWTLYLSSRNDNEAPVSPSDVAMMMTLFKIAREANQHKRDNICDACGYLGIYADMQEGDA